MENKTDIIIEEYIPLKIIINKDDEAVDYLTFSKNNTSYIELTFVINSHFLKRITLLSSREFERSDESLLQPDHPDLSGRRDRALHLLPDRQDKDRNRQ